MKKTKGYLSRWERQAIYLMRAKGKSLREIGEVIGRDKSVVSRELKRNSGKNPSWRHMSGYERAQEAHERALRRYSDSKRGERGSIKLALIRQHICFELREHGSSPESIAGELPSLFPGQSVSGKTIRRWIKREVPELVEALRERGKRRRNRVVTRRKTKKAAPEKVSIDQRPKEVDDHNEAGHFEIDLITCSQSKASILTIRELMTRNITLYPLKNRESETVNGALSAFFHQLPHGLRKSATGDNGAEFAKLHSIKKKYGIDIYYCHPYCSWEKGSVENANKLVREYIPKGSDLSLVTWSELKNIERKINNRPMQCLGFVRPINAMQIEIDLALAA